jgi:hypothetical protein
MLNKDYLWPGLAAITLAIIFPIYWVYVTTITEFDFPKGYYANVLSIDFSDLVYVVLGILEIYIYLSLKRILHDQLNYRGIDILLILMIFNIAVFYLALFMIDISIFLASDYISASLKESILKASYFLSRSCMFIYGVIGLLISIFLLRQSIALPTLLKVFSIMLLIVSLCQVTLIFEFAVILLFPIMILILAVHFLQKPEVIEVV